MSTADTVFWIFISLLLVLIAVLAASYQAGIVTAIFAVGAAVILGTVIVRRIRARRAS